MKTLGKFTLMLLLSVAVVFALMIAFYEIAPPGVKDTYRLVCKWALIWAAIIGYRHAMNAIQES